MCLIISIFITLTFLYDFIVDEKNILNFMFISPVLVIFTMMIYTINKVQYFKLNPFFLSLMVSVTVTAGISFISHLNPFATIASQSTIILFVLYLGIVLPLNLKESLIIFSLIGIFYFLPVFLYIDNYEILMTGENSFFIVPALIFAVLWSKTNFKQRMRIWRLNQYCKSMKQKLQPISGKPNNKLLHNERRMEQTERSAFISQVIGSLVHDLNNFLTIILGKCDLVYDSLPEEDKNRHHIETVTKTCRKASALIKKLLTVSNNQISMPCKQNLNDVINEVKDMVTHSLSRNIDLIIKEAPQLNLIEVDPLQIEQILLNLCINARDAMPKGGKLILETSNVTLDETYCTSRNLSLNPGEYVMATISDTGTGISKKIRSQIFKPFFTTKDKDSGTGLGLSSVYRIIKQSKGDIIVYTEEGKGTVFKLFFPAYKPASVKKYNTKKISASSKTIRIQDNKETVLVVDDNESILHMTSCMLESHGYTVLEADNCEQALSLAKKFNNKIDLMLTDVVLPDMSGKILYEKVRKQCPSIEILYTSGFTSYLLRHYDLLDNTKDLIQKPFTTMELINKVKDALKKKKQMKYIQVNLPINSTVDNKLYSRMGNQ
ncbi:MAG: ATP-binding protein [bacterium]